MNYSIGKTPAIDEIVIKTLDIPVISPEINPLVTLEVIREAIEQVLDKGMNPDHKLEVCQYYESFSPAQLKAALRVVSRRISYANALDEYLEVLYHESVGNDSGLTPHTQVESTPRFYFDAIDEHLMLNLLQGTDSDFSQEMQPKGRFAPIEKRARTKMRDQEREILNTIEQLNYSPKSLPRIIAGEGGVKAEVKDKLSASEIFSAKSSFKKAWERLAETKEIAYQQ